MVLEPTEIQGVFLIKPERVFDERGYFARTYCLEEFAGHGLNFRFDQCSVSRNTYRGQIRGMHFQKDPHGEIKLIRCSRGGIFDVLVDVRKDSPTFKRHIGAELTEKNGWAFLAPPGIAHGFQTLEPDSEVFYQISGKYVPESAFGYRWDDPVFDIRWPVSEIKVGAKDLKWPAFGQN